MVTPLVAVSDNPCRVCCWLFSSACALLCFLVSFCRHLCCPCLLRARAFPCPGAFPCLCLGILSRRVRQSCPSLLPACLWKTPRGYLPCLSTATRLLTAWRPPAVLLRLGCRSHRALHRRLLPPCPAALVALASITLFRARLLPACVLSAAASSWFSSGSGLLLCRTAARPSCLPAPVAPVASSLPFSILSRALGSASLLRACFLPIFRALALAFITL